MKILLVDDEKELSEAVKRVLILNHYEVDQAYDGYEALDAIYQNKYDGIILDVMMPNLDGFSVVKEIRAMGIKTPVIMLTAKAEVDDKVLGLDSGADDYLTKPFSIKELIARIKALLRRNEQEKLENLEIDGLILDRGNYELIADGKVHLTNTEFKVIELLMQNKNSLLSTEKIMDRVWDYDTEAEINVVWVYISSLRKKLEQINSNYQIKAVRGIGYKLEEKNV